jgi:DNA replication protein DnaC
MIAAFTNPAAASADLARQVPAVPATHRNKDVQPADWRCPKCGVTTAYEWAILPSQWIAAVDGRAVRDGEDCTRCVRAAEDHANQCRRWEAVRAAVPLEFHNAWLNQLDPGLGAHIQRWLEDRRNWCLGLFGLPGRGKTHAAVAAIAYAHVQHATPFAWYSMPDWLGSLAKLSDKHRDPTAELVNQRGILGLDNLLTQNVTPARAEAVFRIIDKRRSECRKTIVSANMTLDWLRNEYGGTGAAIASRIAAHVVEVQGPDRRLAK